MTSTYGELLRIEARLPRHFVALMRAVGSPYNHAHVLYHYDLLACKYCELHRHYHTLTHIAECVIAFSRVAHLAKNRNAILLAIFYHDAVYDVGRVDNERASANYFRMTARNAFGITDEPLIEETVRLIELSALHYTDADLDSDGALFIDIDMSILGADTHEYDEYARCVRQEYNHHSDREWAIRRTDKFLDPLLLQESIFLTPTFRASHEECARANLMEERVRLQN